MIGDKSLWVLKNSCVAKCHGNPLRCDALQTTFSVFLDIFYPPNFGEFEETGVFLRPLLIVSTDHIGRVNVFPHHGVHATAPLRHAIRRPTQHNWMGGGATPRSSATHDCGLGVVFGSLLKRPSSLGSQDNRELVKCLPLVPLPIGLWARIAADLLLHKRCFPRPFVPTFS